MNLGPGAAGDGLFTIAGAWFDWEWFMNHYRARFFVGIFGRNGARVFYAVLGLVLVTAGLVMQFVPSCRIGGPDGNP